MRMTSAEMQRSAQRGAPRESEAAEVMARVLRAYAERGMVRELEEAGETASFALPGAGQAKLVCDPAKRTLSLRGLLPAMPPASAVAEELGALLAACADSATPEHRRIAPEQARVAMRRAGGGVSLVMTLQGADWEWAVRRMMNLANEVRVMVHAGHPYWAQAHWGASEE